MFASGIILVGSLALAIMALTNLAIRTGRGLRTVGKWLGDIVSDRAVKALEEHGVSRQEVRDIVAYGRLAESDIVRIVAAHTLSEDEVSKIVDDRLEPIIEQVHYNGGTSIKDQVARILDRLDGMNGFDPPPDDPNL